MFLSDKELTIPDFLQALGFVAPQGFSLDYILAPKEGVSQETEEDIVSSGFDMPDESNNLKYFRKDPKMAQSFSTKNIDITNNTLAPMPINNPRPETNGEELDQLIFKGGKVQSPYKAFHVSESNRNSFKLVLKESVAGLPRNTILGFSKKVVRESEQPAMQTEAHTTPDLTDFNHLSKNMVRCSNLIKNNIAEMMEAINMYNEAANKYWSAYNLKNELISKYQTNKIGSGYGLPAVMAQTVGSYDVNAMKKDSDLLDKACADFEQAEYQKNLYLDNLKNTYKEIQDNMKTLAMIDSNVELWMEQNNNDDWQV